MGEVCLEVPLANTIVLILQKSFSHTKVFFLLPLTELFSEHCQTSEIEFFLQK